MYIETWYRVECPSCGKNNWLNNGDVTDQTAMDVTSFACWNCNKKCNLDPYDNDYDYGDECCDDGLESPC